ncbi:fatty acid desaturase [Haloechinothrix sp. YIM 98757]|uniref:Fatty acid desaturase n=1 Tax=Haloechinothrix aidingensis TaxID=2752311 RepID=A0A838ABE2_9PSEU|nr:fatty acid desaturase [Haloechinothrix aidingensis]
MTTSVEQRPVLSEAESRAVRRGVPDPGIPVPRVSVPTLLLYLASLLLWCVATWSVLGAGVSAWVTVPMHAAVTFLMFTVLHEASHHAAGRYSRVNEALGRMSAPFVAGFASFPAFRFVHIEHHRNTNEHRSIDPDAWTSHGPVWQLPLRWATQDLYYIWFWAPRIRRRPRAEVVETVALAAATIGVITWSVLGGWFWSLAVIYLIPQRFGAMVLAWWFDWLPHHGLTATESQNRFRATRVRVGLEWLLTPLMLYQNYHLVHHLHPAIPFYRYIRAWRCNEDAYVSRDSAIITAWGKELSASEYRAWRKLADSFYTESASDPAEAGRIHRLRVSEVRSLTEDSVAISFELPAELREQFRFVPGQHMTVHVDVDGTTYRRTYSICTSATSDLLRIAVKRVPGGTVSTYLTQRLRAGDRIGVQEPSGRFTLRPDGGARRHYVGVVAGSGITPVISMLSTALLVEEDSRFTLIYGNRDPDNTMFLDELRMLERRFEGRLRVVHHFSGWSSEAAERQRDDGETSVAGRIEPSELTRLTGDPLAVDGWYLCGPQSLVQDVRAALRNDDVDSDRIHIELFHPERATNAAPQAVQTAVDATVAATVRGRRVVFRVEGDRTVLDAALHNNVDAPYACRGGACGTCRARLVQGTVDMEQNLVLGDREVAEGYVLTCQSYPTAAQIVVDYDA